MKNRAQAIKYFLFILPALALFTVFFVIPVFRSLFLSITDTYGFRQTYSIVGLENYKNALTDALFTKSIGTTIKFMVSYVIVVNVLAIAIALLLDMKLAGRNFLRSMFFLPQVMSLLIIGYLWTFLFTNVNLTVEQMLGISGDQHISWLGNGKLSIFSVAIAAVWQGLGYFMILYLSSLQGISEEYLESARIDGANAFHILFKIKIPLLLPMVLMCTILSVSSAFKTFDLPYAMTSGGPNHASETMVLRIYLELTKSLRYGYASAESVILFIIIAIITICLNRVMKRLEDSI